MWRRRGSESGFTLVETLVAIGIILTALLAMAYTATVGFGDIALAKVRQTATGLANQTIEEVRAIAFDRVTHGLANSDLSLGTDPNILANCEGSMTYCFRGEQIPHGSSSALPPLAPHQSSVVLGGVTYSISTYITNYLDDLTSNTYRLTVVVSWTPKVRGVLSTIELQTIVNSPSGCLSSATHPFAAPCQPFLYANAGSGEGSIQVTGSLQSVAFSDATLWAAQPNSNLQVEQISAVQGYSVSSGADLTTTSEQDLGRQRASSAADNDPSQPGLDFQTVSLPAQATGTLTASGGHNSISVTSSGGDTGSSTSTTSATISPSHPCPDTLGVNQTDGYPCGNSKTKQGGTMSSAAVLNDGTGNNSMNLGTATIPRSDGPDTSSRSRTSPTRRRPRPGSRRRRHRSPHRERSSTGTGPATRASPSSRGPAFPWWWAPSPSPTPRTATEPRW